jgi:hypothetical protein
MIVIPAKAEDPLAMIVIPAKAGIILTLEFKMGPRSRPLARTRRG